VCQADALDFLEKHKRKWFSSKQIWKGIGCKITVSTLICNMKRLRKGNSVDWKVCKQNTILYKFRSDGLRKKKV
jgi:hypothetical protein